MAWAHRCHRVRRDDPSQTTPKLKVEVKDALRSPRNVLAISVTLGGLVACQKPPQIIVNDEGGKIAYIVSRMTTTGFEPCRVESEAKLGPIPPFDKDCSRGCRCAKSEEEKEQKPDRYDCEGWNEPGWKLLEFRGAAYFAGIHDPELFYHHYLEWHREDDTCVARLLVSGDIDRDGDFGLFKVTFRYGEDGGRERRGDRDALFE